MALTNGDLAKYSIGAIAIALIGFMGFLTKTFFDYISEHSDKMTTAIEENTEVISELSIVIKMNGFNK